MAMEGSHAGRRWWWFAAVTLVTAGADQLTKAWAKMDLPSDPLGRSIARPFIEGWWDWRLSYNTGSAFGMFHGATGARVFLTVVGIAALGAMVWMVRQSTDDQRRLNIGLGLVAGGAVGNLVDRIAFGKVTDFVVWKYQTHEWPTFNVADAALCVGVGLLMLDMRKKPAAPPSAAAPAKPRGSRRKRP